jgi:hypothetical protein
LKLVEVQQRDAEGSARAAPPAPALVQHRAVRQPVSRVGRRPALQLVLPAAQLLGQLLDVAQQPAPRKLVRQKSRVAPAR